MVKESPLHKLGSGLAKARKKISAGKFFKGKKDSLLNKVKGGVKGLQQTKVKGKSSFISPQSLEPIRPDLKQGGVRKVRRIVTNKVQSLVPKLAKSVTSKVNQFDPNTLLSKIFGGGLNSLNGFASGLSGLKGSLQKNLEFIKEAKGILVDLIEKMAKAKPQKSGGGFFKGLIGTIARVGLMAMSLKAAPAMMGMAAVGGKLALGAGVVAGGAFLTKKILDKRKDKEKEETEVKGDIDAEKFNSIVEKYQKELNIIEKKGRRKKRDEEDKKVDKDKTEETKDEVEKEAKTETKVDPQDEPMGGKSPNALLRIEEDKMIITPKQKAEETSSEVKEKETKVDPPKEENKPQGLKRIAGGVMDQFTRNMFDFDSRGSNVDGIKNFLKGDKGESGGKGGRGALGSQGDPGKKDVVKEQTAIPVPIGPMGILAGGLITGGKFIANKLGERKEEVASKGEKKGNKRGGGVKGKSSDSKIEPSMQSSDNLSQVSMDVSKPAKEPVSRGGGGGIVTVPMPQVSKGKGPMPIQRTENSTKNMIPLYPAINDSNIHIPYARSVFNIVDGS